MGDNFIVPLNTVIRKDSRGTLTVGEALETIERMQNTIESMRTEKTFAGIIAAMREDIKRLEQRNMKCGTKPKRKSKG